MTRSITGSVPTRSSSKNEDVVRVQSKKMSWRSQIRLARTRVYRPNLGNISLLQGIPLQGYQSKDVTAEAVLYKFYDNYSVPVDRDVKALESCR